MRVERTGMSVPLLATSYRRLHRRDLREGRPGRRTLLNQGKLK
jgi:hypothetical protein